MVIQVAKSHSPKRKAWPQNELVCSVIDTEERNEKDKAWCHVLESSHLVKKGEKSCRCHKPAEVNVGCGSGHEIGVGAGERV